MKKDFISVLISPIFLCLIIYSCGPNAEQIAKQKSQDSLNLVEKQRQDSLKLIIEKEKKGEIIWTDNKHGYFVDIRDSKKYRVVKLSLQTIMADNLAYKPNSGNFWAYNNDTNNISKYGYLYNWETAKRSTPIGWHIPGEDEWKTLYKNLGKDTIGVFYQKVGTVSMPFYNLGGWRDENGTFNDLGIGSFWGMQGKGDINPWRFNYDATGSNTFLSGADRNCGYSIRLILD